jgi:hypothetical protein
MDARNSKFAIKLLPSMTDFAFLMPLIFLFARMDGAKSLLYDADAGWHIRTGEWILANGRVPAHDLFSFSKAGKDWYAWEWLTDVIWAWLTSYGGLTALVIFAALLLSLTYALVFRLARRHANPVVALAVTMAGAAASAMHWFARPHLITLLFTVLFYMALERVREGRSRIRGIPYLALLPVATVLWTNLHGAFFVGAILIGAYFGGEVLRMVFAVLPEDRATARRAARNYGLSMVGCLAASLVNPYGYRLHQHIVRYLQDPYQMDHIIEFFSPNFHHPMAIFFEVLLLASVGAVVRSLSKGEFIQPLLIGAWAHAALLSVRNIPIFCIVAAPAVAAAVSDLLGRIPNWNTVAWLRQGAARLNGVLRETAETDSIGRWHPVSALAALAMAALMFAPNPPAKFHAEFDPKMFPAGAVEKLRATPSARIFSYDQWGDYLIYRLFPQTRVFVDGRSDFYGGEFGKKVLDAQHVRSGWEKTLNDYAIDTVLLPSSVPLTGALKESSRWRLVYDDGVALIFRAAVEAQVTTDPMAAAGGASGPLAPSKTDGRHIPSAGSNKGSGRDREITKTEARDLAIAQAYRSTT